MFNLFFAILVTVFPTHGLLLHQEAHTNNPVLL
jgi:hypothetical protein